VPADSVPRSPAGPGSLAGPVRAGVPEHGRVPKYYTVKTALAAVLDELGEGGSLPAERDLAAEFGVARETVRQAIRELLIEGRVRRQGRGTVVAGPKLVQPLSLVSYTEGVRRQGRTPGREVIGTELLPADTSLAEALDISPGDPVLHLERVLLADSERVGLESTYLPKARFPRLLDEFDPETSLYAFLREQLGVRFREAEEQIETVLASPREALLIGTSPALPMLLLNRISRDKDGRPIERVRGLYRGDRFSFTTILR